MRRITWWYRDHVEDLLRVRVERGERSDRREQHPHRVRVVPEALHELLRVLVKVRVKRHVLRELLQLFGGGQLPFQEQPRHLEERGLFGQLLDRIAAVLQDALVAVDEGDLRLARGRVREGRVVSHEAEIVLVHLDLAEVESLDGPLFDGELVALPGAVVRDRHAVFPGHGAILARCHSGAAGRREACLECRR